MLLNICDCDRQKHKKRVLIKVVDERGNPLQNASISLEQKKPRFPFGSAINKNILNNPAYQNWFLSRFKVTVFENEMKWYSTEETQGKEDYSIADSLLKFAKQHNIGVRGHNVFWEDPSHQPRWLSSLSPENFNLAVQKRLHSLVSRYKGQLIAWDVVNENLHFSFLESKLGGSASAKIYNDAHNIDGQTILFLNEYNTIEDRRDSSSTPARYIQKLRQIQSYHGKNNGLMPIGIGLESHFTNPPDLAYMRASIDTLAATGSPIWLTELDVSSQPNQVKLNNMIIYFVVTKRVHLDPLVLLGSKWYKKIVVRNVLNDQ